MRFTSTDKDMSILEYDFMQRALVGGILMGAFAPVLGTFLVLRRISLISDTLAHVALLGLAIGLVTNIWPNIVTFISVCAAAVTIEFMRSRGRMPSDVALAIVLYSTMAGSIVLISSTQGFRIDLFSFLFGSILGLNNSDIWILLLLAATVFICIFIFFSELAQTAFDADLAKVSGVPVGMINLGLALLTAATITFSMRLMGVLLVGTLIVVPFIAGQALFDNLKGAIFSASIIGASSSVLGLVGSFYFDLPAGGAIAIVAVCFLILSVVYRRAVKLLSKPANHY
ncbi:MAG: metal ABC transporter permease [Dehalococcoidia bacterium]|nr:metal ABC transporter permease [Dehalococcoidia bacterium]